MSRKTIEVPQTVSVDGYLGSRYQGPLSGTRLMHNEKLPESYGMIAARPASHIAVRLKGGDVALIFASNPEAARNDQRDFKWTTARMNRGNTSGDLGAFDLTVAEVGRLSLKVGELLEIGTQRSEAQITEIVAYDKTHAVPAEAPLPASSIRQDFLAIVGISAAI